MASIHNSTFSSSELLNNDTFFQIRTLADVHEWGLAYNASDSIRAIAGSTLAAQIVQGLEGTVAAKGRSSQVTVQFGAYASFQSFFGLANLSSAAPGDAFRGIPDYASSMAFELFTTAAPSPFPAPADLRVRFLFANASASDANPLTAFPLFGGAATDLTWADFQDGMNKFAIGDQADWCKACGNTTGVCAGPDAGAGGSGSGGAPGVASASSSGGGSGMSLPVAGVIGAMVTLAVILGVEALVMLLFGLAPGEQEEGGCWCCSDFEWDEGMRERLHRFDGFVVDVTMYHVKRNFRPIKVIFCTTLAGALTPPHGPVIVRHPSLFSVTRNRISEKCSGWLASCILPSYLRHYSPLRTLIRLSKPRYSQGS